MSKSSTHSLRMLWWILIPLFLGILVFSGVKIWQYYADSRDVEQVMSQFDKIDFAALKAINPDTVAWLEVPGTTIDYPVVQADDNEFYLDHSFERQRNQAGWVFADYRNDVDERDDNTIIYGHAMLNGSMFGTLKTTLTRNWQLNYSYEPITLTTPNEVSTWQIFSAYRIKTTDDYLTVNFNDDAERAEFISLIRQRSDFDSGLSVNPDDKILTLSTCSNRSRRMVVHAVLIDTTERR